MFATERDVVCFLQYSLLGSFEFKIGNMYYFVKDVLQLDSFEIISIDFQIHLVGIKL